jgi:hypothetical protein
MSILPEVLFFYLARCQLTDELETEISPQFGVSYFYLQK